MIAKELLKRIKKIDSQMRNKAVELSQTKANGLPVGDLTSCIESLYKERCEIIRTIEELPEAEYDVLHKVYVQGRTLYEVAADRKISYSLATTIHGRALKHLDSLINAKDC